jgi:hypothetical protein
MAQETVTKFFVEHIQRWLDEEMKRDEQLAAKVQQSGKTAEQACNFVLAEVRKSGRCGFDDAEVYGMVRHFFDEDEIKDPGKQDGIERIVIRDTKTDYRVVYVQEWVDNDDSLPENIQI